MAFLNSGGADDIFLKIEEGDQRAKMFRPLADKPIALWGHNVQSIETAALLPTGKNQMVRVRDYIFHRCTSTNRAGVGCGFCNQQDPAWSILDTTDQTNRKGQRVDFPRRPHYLMPVWSYADNAVKVLKGGNQVYEDMDKWDTAGRNVRECDWSIWKEGQKKSTKYKTMRQDATAFNVPLEPGIAEKAMEEALGTYTILTPDEIMKAITPISVDAAVALFMRSNAQSAGLQLPASPTSGLPQLPAAPAGVPTVDPLAGLSAAQIEALKAVLAAQAAGGAVTPPLAVPPQAK
jgi:hypothetical protein